MLYCLFILFSIISKVSPILTVASGNGKGILEVYLDSTPNSKSWNRFDNMTGIWSEASIWNFWL